MRRIIITFATGLILGALTCITLAQARIWYVWINQSTSPATIGVADSSYKVPGWTTLAGPYPNGRAAWDEACRLHRAHQYNAPDIVAGKVRC